MIDDHKSMGDLTPDQQARKALVHILGRIRSDSAIGWYLGHGTESFALATEALAALTGEPVQRVREVFSPINPRNPVKDCEDEERTIILAGISEEEQAALKDAIDLLENQAEAASTAAALDRDHNAFSLLTQARERESLANELFFLSLKLTRAT